MSRLIVNADDFGMGKNRDDAILSEIKNGTVHSTSVSVVNGFDPTRIKKLTQLKAQVGLHVNLSEGQALRSIGHSMTNAEGGFLSAIHTLKFESSLRESDIFEEIRAQFTKFHLLVGRSPSHLDCHQHLCYLSSQLFSAFLRLSRETDTPIRCPLPFLDPSRLAVFKKRVKDDFNVSLPFASHQRSSELRKVWIQKPTKTRTQDCVLDAKEFLNLDNSMGSIEVVCHPSTDNKAESEILGLMALQTAQL